MECFNVEEVEMLRSARPDPLPFTDRPPAASPTPDAERRLPSTTAALSTWSRRFRYLTETGVDDDSSLSESEEEVF